jgi:hypothetical protein
MTWRAALSIFKLRFIKNFLAETIEYVMSNCGGKINYFTRWEACVTDHGI